MNEKLIKERLNDPKVTLVAVTKKHSKEEVDEQYRLGVRTFGENRVQEFLEKYDPNYTWHIIGHLADEQSEIRCRQSRHDRIRGFDKSWPRRLKRKPPSRIWSRTF